MIGSKHVGITEEQLNALGNAWTKKAGEARWYVNDWEDAIGMELVYYKSGNLSDVYYHGGPASHGEGHPSNYWYSRNVSGTKVWIDADGAVHVDYCKDRGVEEDIIARIGERIEALMAPVETVQEIAVEAFAEPEEETGEETAEILRVVRPAGDVAKVVLPVQEGDDLWSAIERSYPEAWDILEPGDIDVIGADGIQLDRWDVMFSPGQGKALAEWFAEVPESVWGAVMDEADLGEWDEGRDMEHPVQPGKWRGHRIEIVYEVPSDAETWDWGDGEWLAAVESIRVAEGSE